MTTTVDPASAVQVGLRALLRDDATLQALIGGRVYDEVPETATGRYVLIQQLRTAPGGSHTRPGALVTVVLETWAPARSNLDLNEVGARLVALLANGEARLDPYVAGHVVWMVKHRFTQTLRSPDRALRGREDRFEISTVQVS